MRVLVTGGEGFIGRALREAAPAHWQVRSLDRRRGGDYWTPVEAIDIPDVRKFRPELIFHLAAVSTIEAGNSDPVDLHRSNVFGTMKVARFAWEIGARVIFASSAGTVYEDGRGEAPMRTEESRLLPMSGYGWSKLFGERIVADNSPPGSASVRLSNIYGPGSNSVVNVFVDEIKDGGAPTIYGGAQGRDFLHVKDAVAALVGLGEDRTPDYGVYNLSSGTATSIDRLYQRVWETIRPEDHPPSPFRVARHLWDIDGYTISSKRLRDATGWRPTMALSDGIRSLV